jgi:tagaturonate reductase
VSDDLEYIVSNTTEAGIVHDTESKYDQVPPISFPAKLTVLLHKRFLAGKKGVAMLSCELIDNNGKELLKCVNQYIDDWGLEPEFKKWVNEENLFCSTLVDRIVPGRIRDAEEVKRLEEENGYHDELIDVGECFGVWVIEGPKELEEQLPFKKAGLNVHVVPDVTPYKHRKVRILNGAHTGFVLGAYLAGFDIVRDCMHDEVVKGFMNKLLDEVIITLKHELDENDLKEFAAAVEDRFNNPFVNHELMSISLNSTSKWKARDLPSFLDYYKEFNKLPEAFTMSLAAYIAFYSNDIQERTEDGLICKRPAGNTYKIQDDAWALDFFYERKDASAESLVHDVLTNTQMWDQDLTQIPGFEAKVVENLKLIREKGAKEAYASVL